MFSSDYLSLLAMNDKQDQPLPSRNFKEDVDNTHSSDYNGSASMMVPDHDSIINTFLESISYSLLLLSFPYFLDICFFLSLDCHQTHPFASV